MSAILPDGEEARRLLVGPESVSWRVVSDVRLYTVMLYPLLLQVAHPTVGAGVHDYSDFERRPWQRLIRTIDYVTLLVYGGEAAIPAGRRLRELHKGFTGTKPDGHRYYALEPEAYAWVHATLIDTYVAGQRHFGRPLSAEETERFYCEYRGLGRLIGVREDSLPPTWPEFRAYVAAMHTELEATDSVRRVLATVGRAKPPLPMPDPLWRALRLPASRVLWLGGLGLMEPRLRRRLGVEWTRRDELAFQTLGRLSRGLEPVLPQRLKTMGPAQLRMRRRAIARGPLGQGDHQALAA